MCVLFPTFSNYSSAIPGIRSPQAGNPLSLRAMPYPPREHCAHTHTYVRIHVTYMRDFFPQPRVPHVPRACACENRSAATSSAGGTARERRGRRERERGREKRKETYDASTPPGRGSSFLGRPLARSVTGSTGILLERCVAIVEQLEESGSPVRTSEIAAPR